ncbi:hypothetical protein FACS1894186_4120 [Alphaproteobacteria bacterium]|nr:hypothetical protein FACS1894186_4120 [Alphaproteobacteria bacterium]
MYDNTNIFAKILRKEIPCQAVAETPHALAFRDISPKAKHHILVIPKGAYEDFADFIARATEEEIVGFYRTARQVLADLQPELGYRLISNSGQRGGQEVPHYHLHILAGQNLGAMVSL